MKAFLCVVLVVAVAVQAQGLSYQKKNTNCEMEALCCEWALGFALNIPEICQVYQTDCKYYLAAMKLDPTCASELGDFTLALNRYIGGFPFCSLVEPSGEEDYCHKLLPNYNSAA